jgi:quaternary ammonium compound-resistance protein SugE
VSRKDKSLGDIKLVSFRLLFFYYFINGGENMAWVYLVIAGIFEVIWAMGLKYSHGFTKLYPSLITLGGMVISFYLLSLATKTLPIGTAYAIWTGIGALGAVLLGIFLFNEPVNALRIVFLCLLLAGILGLKLTSV